MEIFIISIIWWVGSLFALILQLWNFRSSDDEEYEIGDEIITIEVRICIKKLQQFCIKNLQQLQ